MPFSIREYIAAQNGGGDQGSGGYGGGGYSGGYAPGSAPFDWREYLNSYNQVAEANQAMQQEDNQGSWLNNDNREQGRRSSFVDLFNGGTAALYNGQYQQANPFDTAAIEAARGAEWWSNLPANITGNQDLAFDASKFDISKGLNAENLSQIGKFGLSLPGQMVGGVLEGGADLYEALTGRPINEYRKTDKGYEVPDYELDISQRGADLLDSAINIGGLAFGGSARALSQGARAVGGVAQAAKAAGAAEKAAASLRTAAKLDNASGKLDSMSKGILENAWEKTGHKKAGAVLQTGFDVAEEAGEEYVQSLAEDVRNKEFDPNNSFDKASQAAAWGALGGGMMSAGGRGLGVLNDKVFGKPSDASAQSAPQQDRLTYYDEDYSALQKKPGTIRSTEVSDYITTRFQEASKQPGSGVAKCFMGQDDMYLDQADIGDANLLAMYEDSPDAQQVILSDFGKAGITKDEFESALYNREYNGQRYSSPAQALNTMLTDRNAQIELVAQRTPGTHGGRGKVTLRQFTHGDGGSLNPLAYGQLGGDTDGDNMTFFFGADRYPEVAYFSDQLNHPEGASNASWWYSQIGQGLSKSPKHIDTLLEPLKNYTAEDGKTLFERFSPQFKETISRMNDRELSSLFMNVGEEVTNSISNGRVIDSNNVIDGRTMKNKLVNDFGKSRVNAISKVINDMAEITDSSIRTGFEAAGIQEDPLNFLKSRGAMRDATRAADIWNHMGFLAATVIKKGNIPFRQYGQAGFTTKATESYMESVSELQGYVSEEKMVDAFIRASFGMTASGVSPQTAIEGILESFTVAKTMADCGMFMVDGKMQNTIQTQDQLNKFLDVYVQTYNEYTKLYRQAKKQSTSLGEEYAIDYVNRNDLADRNDPALIGNLIRTFGSTPLSMLFDTSKMTQDANGWTFGEFCESVAKRDGAFDAYFAGNPGGNTFTGFISKIQSNYGVTKQRMAKRFDSDMDAIGNNAAEALKYFETHDGSFGAYSNFVIEYVNMLDAMMDPAIALESGLLDPYAIVQTDIGRRIFSDNADTRKNAFISLNIYHQFANIRTMLQSDDNKLVAQAISELSDLCDVSPLHAIIAQELVDNNGESKTLSIVLDPNRTYKEKSDSLNKLFNSEVDADFNYAIDSLRTESSEFDLSSVSARMRRAESYSGNAQKMLYAKAREQYEQLRSMIEKDSNAGIRLQEYIGEIGRLTPSEVNLDLIGAQVYESLIIAHKAIEKGTTQQVNGLMADDLARSFNGCMSPKLVTMFGLEQGIVDVSMFQSNFKMIIRVLTSSPSEYTIDLRNEKTGENAPLNRDTIFATIGENLNGAEPNYQQWMKLFNRYPQLLDWMSTIKSNAAFSAKTDTTTPAKARSFTAGFSDYLSAHRSISSEKSLDKYEAYKGVQELSNVLLDNPRYKTYMLACLAKDLEDTTMTPAELSKRVNSFHRRTTKQIYLALHQAPGGQSEADALNKFKADLYQTNFNQFQALANIGLEFAQRQSIVSASGPELAKSIDMANATGSFIPVYSNALKDTLVGKILDNVDDSISSAIADAVTSEFDAVYESVNQAYESYGKDLQRRMDIVSALFNEFADDIVVSDRTNTVDRNIVDDLKKEIARNIKNRIRSATAQNDNIDTAALIASINETIESETDAILSKFEDQLKSNQSVSDIVLNLDEDFVNEQTLLQKVKYLYSVVGSYKKSDDDIRAEIAKALTDRNEAEKLRNNWLNIVLEHEISTINNITYGDTNENMLMMTQDIASFYDDLFSNSPGSLRDQLRSKKLLFDGSAKRLADALEISETPSVPTPTTTSSIAQIAATNMRIMDDSAGTAILVSINGAQMKQHFGYALLPAANKTSSEPTKTTVGELKAMIEKDHNVRRWKMVTFGIWDPNDTDSWQVDSIGNKLDSMDDAADVFYFDPIENPHGLSNANTPATPEPSPNREWHRLSAIFGKLDDTTMEAMVMKAKKSFASKTEITEKFNDSWFKRKDVSVNIGDGSDASSTYSAMKETMKAFRQSYAETIAKEFRDGGSLDSTEFDTEQATLIACNLTPGIKLTINDGVTNYDIMVDSRLIFGDEATFNAAWPNIINAGSGPGTIVACQIYTVTPTEFSYKIMNPVLAEYHKTNDINAVDIHNLAEEAAENWGDYKFNNLSIEKALDGIKPIGYHIQHGIKLSDSQTAPQIVLDEQFNGSFGVSNRRLGTTASKPKFLETDGKDKALWGTAQRVARNFRLSNDVPGIVKAYLPTDDQSLSYYGMETGRRLRDELSQLENNTVKGYVAEGNNFSAGIVFDPGQISDALKWATNTRNDLLIPAALVDSMEFGGNFIRLGYEGQLTATFDNTKIELVRLAPRKSSYFRNMTGDTPSSHRLPRHPDEIMMTFVDYDNLYNLTDAGIYATEAGESIMIRRGDYAKFSVSRMMPNEPGVKRIADKNSILNNDSIMSLIDSNGKPVKDNDAWKIFNLDGSNESDIAVKRLIADYISNVRSLAEDNGIMRKKTGKHQCVGFITNGTKFAPIITPSNSASEYSYMDVVLIGDDLLIPWSGSTTLGNSKDFYGGEYMRYMKMAINGEAFKGIVSVLGENEGVHTEAPELVIRIGGKQQKVHFIAGGETESSRANGRDKFFQRQAYFEAMHKYNGSLIYKIDANGNYVIKKEIAENFTPEELIDLVNNNTAIWNRIKNQETKVDENGEVVGRYVLSNNPDINNVISMVLSNCDRYRIEPMTVFSALTQDSNGNIVPDWSDVNYYVAFRDLDFNKMALFFSNMFESDRTEDQNLRFCPAGNNDPAFNESTWDNYLFDDRGWTRCAIPFAKSNQKGFYPVRWGKHEVIGDESFLRTPTGEGKFPMQEFYRRAYDVGLLPSQYQRAMEYADYLTNNNEYVIEFARSQARERRRNAADRAKISENPELATLNALRNNPGINFLELKNQKVVASMGKTLSYRRQVIGPDDQVIEDPMTYDGDRQLQQYVKEFKNIFGDSITFDIIDWWCKGQDGYTYNQGVGKDDISLSNLKRAMSQVLENLRGKGIPITCYPGGRSFDDRYALPGQVQYQIDWAWEHGREFLESKHGTKEEYARKIAEETEKALEAITNIDKADISQRIRLSQAMQWYYREIGKPIPSALYVYNGTYVMDIADMYDDIVSNLIGSGVLSSDMVEEMRDMAERERQVLADIRNRVEMNDIRHKASVPITPGGMVSSADYNDAWPAERLLNNIATASQIMAVSHPLVSASNLIDRFTGQTCMDWGLRIAQKTNLGPYKAVHWLDPKIVDQAVNDPMFVKLYIAYRKAGFTGEELTFLSQANSVEDIDAWLANREKNQTPFQKAVDRIYGFASGGNIFLKTQMKNFINRFAQFAESSGQDFWFEDVGGMSLLEASIAGDGAAKWFSDVLGANEAYTPSFTIAMQALNSAKAGDMAQRHVVSMMYAEIVRRMPISKFFVTTTVSRFPQYALNVTHRMLNWVAPMSSVYYVFTKMVSKISPDMHFEQAQVHRSLQEAMYVDLVHLGRTALCMVLIGCSGLMEPPDDEKKWMNIDDWTIGGMRIGTEWWIKDVLGMALPVAAFARASMLGRPDLSIISNGLADVCFSNPIIKVSDAIGFLLDPEDGMITSFEEDQKNYAKAPQGGPSDFMEYLAVQGKAASLSWAAQFITPSFLRDFYISMQPYEASYKKVFRASATGVTETDESKTHLTTYEDAMIRRVTRRNPTLAWLLDAVVNPETGYAWDEMPRTVMYDDAQRAAAEIWSIKGLDDQSANQKLMEIIEVLQQYDDMNELRQTGFYLDAETRTALSSTVWDIYHGLDDWWNSANQSGQLDFYVLGNGSYTDGREIYYQLKQDIANQKQQWSNFYYDKIKNSYLSQPMQQYNRYNTTYNRDADGNIYATGIRPSGVVPFTVAPGTLSDPGITAGYENDWASVSAVTGTPMNQRALVPVPNEYEAWPGLEDWADGGDGNSYSTRYRQQYGTAGSAYGGTGANASTYPKSSGKTSGGYSGSGFRYGGGGGGGGGGGYRGSGGSPNFYAPSVSLSKANPGKIMNTDRVVKPDLDYLRPDFETKGSREAYRRSDI